jgi:Predicted hydrolases or acyltransferases (alpha/beta hydrolase superfamily)
MLNSRIIGFWRQWFAAALFLSLGSLTHAGTAYTLTTPDGLAIAVQEHGDPDGQPIVFVHGLLGSHLSWEAQTQSALLQNHRLITYDMRGHGRSDKPDDESFYVDGSRWGDELATVIDWISAERPILVGWSLGAAVISNYLATHGDVDIAGAVYVGGVIELTEEQIVQRPELYAALASAELKTHLDAEREFIALCFEQQPDPETFQRLLANGALASDTMQRAVQRMTVDATRGLGNMSKPLLLIYGAHDALVQAQASNRRAQQLMPQAQTLIYPDSGHAPFLEEAERFNRDLVAFVEAVRRAEAE